MAHATRDNAARLYTALKNEPWTAHAKVVLATGDGLAAPSHAYDIFQPLTPLKVETWADFSSRLPSQRAPGVDAGFIPAPHEQQQPVQEQQQQQQEGAASSKQVPPPPLSAEGGPQRCFRQLFVCMNDVQLAEGNFLVHEYGQRMVEFHRHRLAPAQQQKEKQPEQQQQQQQLAPQPPEALQRRLALQASGGGKGEGGSGGKEEEHELRILFHRRGDDGLNRQLLNALELLQRCNSWRHTTPSGARLRARCWEVRPPLTALKITSPVHCASLIHPQPR